MNKKVIIYGTGVTGKMLYYDSLNHPNFKVASFIVEEKYLTVSGTFFGLPVINYEKIIETHSPDDYDMIIADSSYFNMDGRMKLYHKIKSFGYKLVNYISSTANIEPDVVMGENNLIFGQTHIGFGGTMGSNNIIRQQVYLGHEFSIGDNNIIGPAVTIGGECIFENSCYVGIDAVIIDKIKIAKGTFIGGGSVVIRDTGPHTRNVGNPSRIIKYINKDD